MSIRPVLVDGDDVTVWHDERKHSGVLSLSKIAFPLRIDGTADLRFLILECPVEGCGSSSSHPVSGGADPEAVQALFAHVYRNHKSAELRDIKTWEKAVDRVRQLSDALDGPGRFRLRDKENVLKRA